MIIYHKSNCATSLKTLALIKKHKIKPQIIHYLETPPTITELKSLLKMLGIKAEKLVRKKEKLYQEKYAEKNYTELQWIKILHANPILIERPIVVEGKRAVLGRPPENILELIK